MIYLKFIPVILYLVEVFGSPLDDTTNPIDVQNSLNDKGTSNSLEIQLDEYHDENDEMYDDKIDEYNNADYENYGEQDRFGGRPRNPGFGGRPQGQGGFGFRPQRTELDGILSSQNVSCGNHEAHSCQDCPFVHKPTTVTSTTTTITSTEGNGATWCNGDCIWSNNQCVAAEAGQEGSGSSNLLGIPILNDQLAPEYNDDKIDEYDQEGFGTTSNLLGVPIINDNLAPEYQGFGGRPQSPGFGSGPQVQSRFRSKPQRPGFGGRPPQVQGGVGTSNSYNYDYAENYGDNYNEQELKDYLGSGYNEAIARSWNSSIGDFKNHTPEWWKNYLSPEVYRICREKGTEPSGSGKYDKFNETGIYYCNCCGHDFPLFSSDAKYDSGTGWPSFWEPINNSSVTYNSNEVVCSRCEGHLGHVFNDGPANKTGKRFCMNSLALHFVPQLEVENFYSNLN